MLLSTAEVIFDWFLQPQRAVWGQCLVLRLWLHLGLGWCSRQGITWETVDIKANIHGCAYVCVRVSECVCHKNATGHANVSASQARTEDMPCSFMISQSYCVKEADATHHSSPPRKIILSDVLT